MACTKETYTATATWTASQLADLFRDAFIDAGLMTAWHDSFLSGSVENRILEEVYDGAKTYGKTYYWFMFTTSGVFLHVATGWNTGTDQPTGTQYLDFFSTTTNATTNHWTVASLTATNTVELVRYTSGVDVNQSWFVLKSAATRFCFTIVNGASTLQSYLDLNKGFFQGFHYSSPLTQTGAGTLTFARGPGLRRDLIIGSSLVGSTGIADYAANAASIAVMAYGVVGNASNAFTNNAWTTFSRSANFTASSGTRAGAIILPTGFTATNPAYASNSNPVFHSMPFTPYVTSSLPSDLGLTFHYATNTFSPGDTFVVSAGVEEWEVLDFAANTSAVTGASPLFLARMV